MKNFLRIYKRLERIDQLLHFKCTGTAKDLSERLGISERAVFYNFNILKTFGFNIEYSSNDGTYYYVNRKPKAIQDQSYGSMEQ